MHDGMSTHSQNRSGTLAGRSSRAIPGQKAQRVIAIAAPDNSTAETKDSKIHRSSSIQIKQLQPRQRMPMGMRQGAAPLGGKRPFALSKRVCPKNARQTWGNRGQCGPRTPAWYVPYQHTRAAAGALPCAPAARLLSWCHTAPGSPLPVQGPGRRHAPRRGGRRHAAA